ncbi:MAG TPA: porin [Gammaproteobacteria bacterium]|nr:porin [Gammaproteobacteria bacterium]
MKLRTPSLLKPAALALLISAALSGNALAAGNPELETLKNELDTVKEKLELTLDMLEGQGGQDGGHGSSGNTTVGGYGEMHYSNLSNQTTGGADKKEIDFHRFIIFLGHEFNDKVRFFSELEVEHAQTDKDGGEVAMEQAYLEFDLGPDTVSRAGIFLVPAGIINETHEPPTFYGVERNPVEKNIIPTTWREGGVSLSGRIQPGLSYDLALHSGLETGLMSGTKTINYAVRKGRNAVREAAANDPAITARLKWTGLPGLEVAATVQQQGDITQGSDSTAGSATLLETHVVWQKGPMGLRALYATWSLEGTGPAAVGADEQTGWYIEPAYKVTPKLGLFARYNQWDNQAGDNTDSEYAQTNIGVNYWPHPDVVIKADYQTQDVPAGKDEFQGINLGVGYQF